MSIRVEIIHCLIRAPGGVKTFLVEEHRHGVRVKFHPQRIQIIRALTIQQAVHA